jgi:hypothetical protein
MNERYKIGEAKYFLARMEESLGDREAFMYYLSALGTAARSVTKYAREESRSKGRQLWFYETIAAYDLLVYSTQAKHRVADYPGSEDRIGSSPRHSKNLIILSHRYIRELEGFVQRGIEEGILSG